MLSKPENHWNLPVIILSNCQLYGEHCFMQSLHWHAILTKRWLVLGLDSKLQGLLMVFKDVTPIFQQSPAMHMNEQSPAMHIKKCEWLLNSTANDIRNSLTSMLPLIYCISKRVITIVTYNSYVWVFQQEKWISFFVRGTIIEKNTDEVKTVKLFQRSHWKLWSWHCVQNLQIFFFTPQLLYIIPKLSTIIHERITDFSCNYFAKYLQVSF